MRLTPAEVELQRVRIIESATNEFLSKGYSATRMEDIAKGAGISRSPLYYHFKKKDELFYEVFSELCSRMEKLEEEAYSSGLSIFDCLYNCLVSSVGVLNGQIELLRTSILHHSEELKKSQERSDLFYRRAKEIKINAFSAAVKRGELRPDCSPVVLTSIVLLFCKGAVTELHFMRSEGYDDSYILKIVKEFVDTIRESYGNHKN